MLGYAILLGLAFSKLLKKAGTKTLTLIIILLPLIAYYFATPIFTTCNTYQLLGSELSKLSNGNVANPAWPYLTYYSNKLTKWMPGTYQQLLNETQTFNLKYVVTTTTSPEPEWSTTQYFKQVTEFQEIKTVKDCGREYTIFQYVNQTNQSPQTPQNDIINKFAFTRPRLI